MEPIYRAAIIGTGATLEPAAADRRLGDAGLMAQRAGEVVDDAVRIGIARIWPDFETGLAETRREHAPMRGGVGVANRIAHSVVSFAAGGRHWHQLTQISHTNP